jgi:23S rRNA (adenine2503-C2)-methyltransferase
MDKDLKNKSYNELLEIIIEHKQKSFCGQYLFSFIHQKDAVEINDVTPLSKLLRTELTDEGYFISQINLSEQHDDPDGTIKFVFELNDSARIESVRLKDGDRNTLCISTQAGCRMGCKFCATGQLEFQRDLTAAEIVDQVYQAERLCGRIDNLVYMGMGEPLDNFDNVMRSIKILNDKNGRTIGIRHITLSTCGLPEEILKHIIGALKGYQELTAKRITIEYCMIDGINDQVEHAKALVRLLKPLRFNVNLIELNPFPGSRYSASSPKQIQQFAKILSDSSIETIIRFKRGRSIKAACGQLGATWLK